MESTQLLPEKASIALENEQVDYLGTTSTGGLAVRFDQSNVHTELTPLEHEILASQGESALLSPVTKQEGVISFPDLPDNLRALVKKRLVYVEALQADRYLKKTEASIQPIVDAVAAKIRDENPPSWVTAYRWLRAYEESERHLLVLIPEYKKRGRKGYYKQPGHDLSSTGALFRITKIIVEKHYLKAERLPVTEVYELLKQLIENQNTTGLEEHEIVIPHINTFRHFIKKHFDPYTIDKARHGKVYADHKWTPRGIGPRPERPLERVEIDHTPLDIIVIDDETHLPLGRLSFIAAIDKATRCIIGFSASFESESWLSVKNCLIHAISPKAGVKGTFGLSNDWPCHGLMETLVLDNGRGFRNQSMYDACLQLGIKVVYAPPRTPQFKGTIERFFRRQNDSLLHSTPGTTFSNVLAKGDYNPVKNSIIRLSDFNRILHTWIVDIYHQEIHQGLEGIPAKVWEEKIKLYPPVDPPDLSVLQVLLGQVATRAPSPSKGIEMYGLHYNCSELSLALLKSVNRGKAKIKFDPSDISTVYFEDKSQGCFIPVPCTDQKYTQGLSLWQHRIIKNFLRDELRRSVDVAGLREARMRIQQIVEQAVLNSKRIRKAASRYLGKGLDTNYQNDSDEIVASPLSPQLLFTGGKLPAVDSKPFDGIGNIGDGYPSDAPPVLSIEGSELADLTENGVNKKRKRAKNTKDSAEIAINPVTPISSSALSSNTTSTVTDELDLSDWGETIAIPIGRGASK